MSQIVFLVRAASRSGPFEIRECDAEPYPESGTWLVNVRGSSCRSKQFQVLPDEKVYKSWADAERRVKQLEAGEVR